MPKILVSSVGVKRETPLELMQPILGVCPYVGFSHQVYAKNEMDLMIKMGSNNLDRERALLSSGYSLKIAPHFHYESHKKGIRILENGSYCYPNFDSDVSTETLKDYKFDEYYEGNKVLAMKFPLAPLEHAKDMDYILINNGVYGVLLYWGEYIPIELNYAWEHIRVYKNDTEGLIESLRRECGYNVEEVYEDVIDENGKISVDHYLVLSRGIPFLSNFFTTLSDFNMTSDLNGCSDVINKYVKTLVEFTTKNDRYQDDICIDISKSIDSQYIINVVIDNKILEQFSFDYTQTTLNYINENSEIIQMKMYATEGNIVGTYYLRRDYKGSITVNSVTPKNFDGFPYVSAYITKNFDMLTDVVLNFRPTDSSCIGFDSNEAVGWQTGIAKHIGWYVKDGIKYDSEVLFLTRLREGAVLGSTTELDEIENDSSLDYNQILDEYSFELLNWNYLKDVDRISLIPNFSIKLMTDGLRNNLQYKSPITTDLINKIVNYYSIWLTSIKSVTVDSITRENQTQYVNLTITQDGFNGNTRNISVSIKVE